MSIQGIQRALALIVAAASLAACLPGGARVEDPLLKVENGVLTPPKDDSGVLLTPPLQHGPEEKQSNDTHFLHSSLVHQNSETRKKRAPTFCHKCGGGYGSYGGGGYGGGGWGGGGCGGGGCGGGGGNPTKIIVVPVTIQKGWGGGGGYGGGGHGHGGGGYGNGGGGHGHGGYGGGGSGGGCQSGCCSGQCGGGGGGGGYGGAYASASASASSYSSGGGWGKK